MLLRPLGQLRCRSDIGGVTVVLLDHGNRGPHVFGKGVDLNAMLEAERRIGVPEGIQGSQVPSLLPWEHFWRFLAALQLTQFL